ncbi:CidA/LrgA family protein [Desulfuromonas carbonis]|uniref:CidA/LrgA family protein n=1 Tax=Desulfuromonas sp. DDH964 TaxID=1823759 RepID=UPI00078DC92E|nr:CidA/LrgA family protein [Desulfuromonas sp. DDH964]AMV72614.1 Antiholin-like protein LrgA [Desulfuromonas sp. DDH964]
MVRGFAVLLGLQFLGEVLARGLGLPIPGNVLGMGLLLIGLLLGWIEEGSIRDAAELLLSHMALLFVPAGVGVMVYFDLLRREWLAIIVALVVSTFVVMAVTGWTEAWLEKRGGAHVD